MRLLCVLLAAVCACGSAFAQSDIEAVDRGIVIPSLRFSFDIAGEVGPQGPAVPHSGHAIELGLTGGSGKDSQSLGSSEFVRFDSRNFNGPTTLEHEFDFHVFELAYRYRRFFGSGVFGIEALGGLGFAEVEFSTRSPTGSASEKISSGGIVGAFGVIWKFLPTAYLQPRLTIFASGEEEGVSAAARFDVQVAWAFARNVALRGGLTSWAFTSARGDARNATSPDSRVTAAASGVSIGLDVAF